jgi:hypothetical protein
MEGISFWTPVWHRNTLAQWSDRFFNFGSQVAVIDIDGVTQVTLHDRPNPPVWIASRVVLIAGSILMSLQNLVSTKQLSNLHHLPAAVLTALFLIKVYCRWGIKYEVSNPHLKFDSHRLEEVLKTLPASHASIIRVAAQGMVCLAPKEKRNQTWQIYLDKPKQYPVQIQDTNICWFGALLDELRREAHPDKANSYTAMSAAFAMVCLTLCNGIQPENSEFWVVIRDALSFYAKIPETQKDIGVNGLPTIRENYNTLIDLLKPYQKPAGWNFAADTAAVKKSSLPRGNIANEDIKSLIEKAKTIHGISLEIIDKTPASAVLEMQSLIKGIMESPSNPLDVLIGTYDGKYSYFAIRVTNSAQECVAILIPDKDESRGWTQITQPIFDQDNLKALIENRRAIDVSGEQWSLC